jgi:hypothetical protein
MDRRQEVQLYNSLRIMSHHLDNPIRIKFRVSVNKDKAEETITYNKILEYITRDEESDIMWKFQQIISHEAQGSQINTTLNMTAEIRPD